MNARDCLTSLNKKTNLLAEQKKELEAYEKDKSSLDEAKIAQENLVKAQNELQKKNSEIEFLKQQLKKKEDENRALKEDKARILKE